MIHEGMVLEYSGPSLALIDNQRDATLQGMGVQVSAFVGRPFASDFAGLVEVGSRVRDIFADGSTRGERIRQLVDKGFLDRLAGLVAGKLGGKVGVAPRIFLKKLVADILDKIDQHPDFDPGRDYSLSLVPSELNEAEKAATPASSVNDIELKL